MSKVDDILDEIDSGGDRDVVFSARQGSRVLLEYSDGTQIVVQARLIIDPTPPDSGEGDR